VQPAPVLVHVVVVLLRVLDGMLSHF
jgi:hypothetical protein